MMNRELVKLGIIIWQSNAKHSLVKHLILVIVEIEFLYSSTTWNMIKKDGKVIG